MMGKKIVGSVTDFDNELRKKVRAMEVDIPGDLEERFLKELDRLDARPGDSAKPAFPRLSRKSRVYSGTLAAAASLLLVVFLAVTVLFRPSPAPVAVEQEVVVDYAEVDGQPANTYIVSQHDPDITIIWLEKAPVISMNRNIDTSTNKYKEI